MPFLSSREYCLRLIAMAYAQAGCPANVVALESLRATHFIRKDAACCRKVVDPNPPNKGQPPNSGQSVVYQLVRCWEDKYKGGFITRMRVQVGIERNWQVVAWGGFIVSSPEGDVFLPLSYWGNPMKV